MTTFTVCSGVVLLIMSSLLAVEADEVRRISRLTNEEKCLKCGKINVAAVSIHPLKSWSSFITVNRHLLHSGIGSTFLHIELKEPLNLEFS